MLARGCHAPQDEKCNGANLPGAVWRSGWVDMTEVVCMVAPLGSGEGSSCDAFCMESGGRCQASGVARGRVRRSLSRNSRRDGEDWKNASERKQSLLHVAGRDEPRSSPMPSSRAPRAASQSRGGMRPCDWRAMRGADWLAARGAGPGRGPAPAWGAFSFATKQPRRHAGTGLDASLLSKHVNTRPLQPHHACSPVTFSLGQFSPAPSSVRCIPRHKHLHLHHGCRHPPSPSQNWRRPELANARDSLIHRFPPLSCRTLLKP